MAFLNNLTRRPSCIVSHLPPKFTQSLIRDLEGSVAISTCELDELSQAVGLRGATLAVIGASPQSYQIAEQLSHDELSIKVFLVRVDDSLPQLAYKNGFAGIVDLRTDYEHFAEALRDAANSSGTPGSRLIPDTRSRKDLSACLLAYGRYDGLNDVAELILNGFLEITHAMQGLLLVPGVNESFKVICGSGFEGSLPASCVIPDDILAALESGRSVRSLKAQALPLRWSGPFAHKFTFVLPLLADSKLQGCLIANTAEISESVARYGSSASRIWIEAQIENSLQSIQSSLSSIYSKFGWLLVSSEGAVTHVANCPEEWNLHAGENLHLPRLKGMVQKALLGEEGTTDFQGYSLHYRSEALLSKSHALLVVNKEPPTRSELAEDLPLDVLIKFLNSELQTSSVDIEISGLQNVAPDLSVGLALQARALVQLIGCKLSFKVSSTGNQVSLLFEANEALLQEPLTERIIFASAHWLMRYTINTTSFRFGLTEWKAGTFGGKITFQQNIDLSHL